MNKKEIQRMIIELVLKISDEKALKTVYYFIQKIWLDL